MNKIFEIAFPIFLMMDPLGNIPLFISALKDVKYPRKKWVVLREMIIALLIIFSFVFVGDGLFRLLHVTQDTIQIAGGVILFIIALKLIFPSSSSKEEKSVKTEEPFIVPLAVPLVAGPAVLAAVMLYSQQITTTWTILTGISVAWFASLIILLSSAFISKILKKKGIIACERLMGLILVMIGIQMLLEGISLFISRQGAV